MSAERPSPTEEVSRGPSASDRLVKTPAFRYRAFLSYSHRDTAWGKWLHGALEGYRIDKDLVGRETPVGGVPKTLRPIFRDREDFSAGPSLKEQTRAALEGSQFLVVICSPNAARSQYVNEEVRRYKALGRTSQVIPVIVDGKPGDPERECFPPALRFQVGLDGALTDEREEPIAADAQPQGDGKDVAKLKVVAGLLGLGLDEIVRRAERARRRRLRNWVAALALLTVTFAGLAGWAEMQRRYAEQALDGGIRTANSLALDLAMRFRNRAGVQSALVKYLLDQAMLLQEKLSSFGRTTPDLQRSQARALLEISQTLLTIGDSSGALSSAERGRQIIVGLLAVNSDDPDWQQNLALSYERAGDALGAQGKFDEALDAYRNALAIIQKVVDADSGNTGAQSLLAIEYTKIGTVLSNQEHKYDEALAAYRMSIAIQQKLELQRGLAISYERVGDVLLAQGKREEALAAFQKRLSIAQELADKDSGNTDLQSDLSVAFDKIGDVLLEAGKDEEALSAYQKGLVIRQKLVDSDRGNKLWQRSLATSYYKIGGTMLHAGKLDEALAAFQKTRAISQSLALGDPGNIQWQRDILMSSRMVAAVLQDQGKLDDALKAYRDTLAIALTQAKAFPKDVNWQGELRFCIIQIGGLAYKLIVARQFASALESAEQTIALAPDMIWLCSNRAHALMFLDRSDEARALYLHYRGEKDVWEQESWEDFILGEFAQLRKARLTHPLMDEIEKRFTAGG